MEEGDEEELDKDDLIFEKKSISIFRIYCHLFEGIDWLLAFLGIVGSLGAGVSMPLMTYISSDIYSDVGNTSERRYSSHPATRTEIPTHTERPMKRSSAAGSERP